MAGRLEKEIRTYDLLDALGIEYERVDHEEANTMEAFAAVDEVLAPAVICKNLFLCNRQQTDYYLLLIPGDKVFKTKYLSAPLGCARLSFAGAEAMETFLKIKPGSVSPMGLMNDTERRIRFVIDRDVLSTADLGCHINETLMEIMTWNKLRNKTSVLLKNGFQSAKLRLFFAIYIHLISMLQLFSYILCK